LAFQSCSSLTSINIPDSVTSIGDYAFYLCSSLTSATIPNSVTSIGEDAFALCSGLTSINIPDSVTSIGGYVFENCTGLTSVTIGNNVTSIGDYAFYACTGLTSITIPDSVTSIGDGAFYNCTGLTSVTIPDSVTSIGDYAFYNCSSAAIIYYPYGATGYAASYDGVPTQEEAAPFVTIDPISKSTVSAGESYDITVSSNTDWTVTESLDWASVSPASGSGNGTVTVTVGANIATSPRSGTIAIGGQAHSLSQNGAAPFVTIDPISKSTVSAGESYDITVSSNTDWTATESLDWASVSLASGSGDSTVTVTVDANIALGARSGTISIGGELHTLVQDGTDTDSDGLLDSYEQTIIDADLGDAIDGLDDVLPGDDFDGDGRTNLQEQNEGTDPIDAGSYRTPPQEARWEPAGWVYYAWPYAYDSTEGRWHFFNQSNKQWRVNLSDSEWATLDAATGWNYYAWPYSYSSDQSTWHWYNSNIQWVVDLASGDWELFGGSD
jgi:hypothetical protein